MVAERFPLHEMPVDAAAPMAAATGHGHDVATPEAGRAGIPQWNGEAEKLNTYRFDVKMFIMSVRKNDRYLCGPLLVRGLGPRVKTFAESYGQLAKLDEVNEAGECTGWEAFFTYVLEKLNLTTVQDTGPLTEQHPTRRRRNPEKLDPDRIARFERSEREQRPQLRVTLEETEELTGPPSRARRSLRRAGFLTLEGGEIWSRGACSCEFGCRGGCRGEIWM